MKIGYDEVIAERTGRKGAEALCLRCYREHPRRLEWAYGATMAEVHENLKAAPEVIDLSDLETVFEQKGMDTE